MTQIFTEPPVVDIYEQYAGEYDGSEIITQKWGDITIHSKKDSALDGAYGIFHVASEPCPKCQYASRIDWGTAFSAFLLITCLTMYAWLLWQGLSLFF